ncbi:putative aldehyde dehydrogenase (NAD(P)+) [Patulibacter medicamentivorans]|uniref:Putative aldehyde dehydrogenase (NAD(P)+) n=1 Tax=Patulibacter medicamentivorans TaxID=1097667 RepID=H0E2N0_9ACTN|nr:aldehyde dehydrogenase family protein [Patulibacter medicamentivorans]EHN12044.1 putative aldehyde dehydrogenase (NAD(P)+) [Patulibacter medicamentivorans]
MSTITEDQAASAVPDGFASDLSALRSAATRWARLPLADKRRLLTGLHDAVAEHAEEWVRLTCKGKGLELSSPLAGEEWVSGPWVHLGFTHALGRSLDALLEGRAPIDDVGVEMAPGGRLSVPVLPFDVFDRLLLSGFKAEVWLEPGITLDQARTRSASRLKEPDEGGVALVLGAGNISSIAPLDTLHKLYTDGRVVLLKLNPVNAYLKPLLEKVFHEFIAADFVRIVAGDGAVGARLVADPEVDEIHVTGSAATHDAIVFGGGEEGAKRKAKGEPLISKEVTSELGGVSPVIVMPGRWSAADLKFQAEHVATQRLHNGGYNCIAAQVVVLPAGWAQGPQFIEHLRDAIKRTPPRPAYYPGSDARVERALEVHGDARVWSDAPGRSLVQVDAQAFDDAFCTEYFAPVLAVTELPAPSAQEFLDNAVEFSNERLVGTLGANLIVDPRTKRQLGAGLRAAVADLRYGTIAINCWTGVGYMTPRASWGAFPGHSAEDIQSGVGVVHNALLLEGTERTVVEGPFRPAPRALLGGELTMSPKPPWFVTNRTANVTARRLTRFAAKPRWSRLPGIFASALRG